jgi:hypothetical protein
MSHTLLDRWEAPRMLMTGSNPTDAELAFTRATRSRRRAALARWLRRGSDGDGRLSVHDGSTLCSTSSQARQGVSEIPLSAIRGTLEPSRASMFDGSFRPAASARSRWQRLWLLEQRGGSLPPISVVAVGDAYAVRDGHHRVSVARARGALSIVAIVA